MLLDIRMPKMNGYELYDKMKKIDTKVKVCFMSAYDIKSDPLQEQFGSLQIECFISKPIEISESDKNTRDRINKATEQTIKFDFLIKW